jgi:hypothetical protein
MSSDQSTLSHLSTHQQDLSHDLWALLTALSIQSRTRSGACWSRAARGACGARGGGGGGAGRRGCATAGLVGANNLVDLIDQGDHLDT